MSITIPAHEVRKGDVIDFGGQPFTVKRNDPHPTVAEVTTIWGCCHPHACYDHSAIIANPDTLFNVQRPDPDPVVTVSTYSVEVDGEQAGFVSVTNGKFIGYNFGDRTSADPAPNGRIQPTLEDAVAVIASCHRARRESVTA